MTTLTEAYRVMRWTALWRCHPVFYPECGADVADTDPDGHATTCPDCLDTPEDAS